MNRGRRIIRDAKQDGRERGAYIPLNPTVQSRMFQFNKMKKRGKRH